MQDTKGCTVGDFSDVAGNLKAGRQENKRETAEGEVAAYERLTHERTGHAMCDLRFETCLKVRGVTTHPRRAVAEAAYVDYAVVRNSQQGAEVNILVGAGPFGETLARAVHGNGGKIRRS